MTVKEIVAHAVPLGWRLVGKPSWKRENFPVLVLQFEKVCGDQFPAWLSPQARRFVVIEVDTACCAEPDDYWAAEWLRQVVDLEVAYATGQNEQP